LQPALEMAMTEEEALEATMVAGEALEATMMLEATMAEEWAGR